MLRSAVMSWLRASVVVMTACHGATHPAPSIDPTASTLTLDRGFGVVADGVDHASLAAHLTSTTGEVLTDCTIQLSVDGPQITVDGLGPTDDSGNSTAQLSSTVAGHRVLAASAVCGGDDPVPFGDRLDFDLVAGPITAIAFLVQPSNTIIGADVAPAVQVALTDALGNISTENTGFVALQLASGEPTLVGTTAVDLDHGVATFDDLRIYTPGQGYTMWAFASISADGTPLPFSGTSTPFDVAVGAPSGQSSLVLSPATADADGIATVTATLTLVNTAGVAIAGQPVAFQASGAGNDVFPTQGTTDYQGKASATIASNVAGTKVVTATAGTFALSQTATFLAPSCVLAFPGLPVQLLEAGASGMFASDLDGDGHLDLAISAANHLSIMRGLGNGRFGAPHRYPTAGSDTSYPVITGGDVDGDGHLDLVVAVPVDNGFQGELFVFRGTGTLEPAPPITTSFPDQPIAVAVGDLDGDGKLDVVVRTTGSVVVMLGAGDGTFPTQYSTVVSGFSSGGAALAVVDVNSDGRPDVITSDDATGVNILLTQIDGSLRAPHVVVRVPGGFAAADFDGDGKVDLAVPCGGTLCFEHGRGDGTFVQTTQAGIGAGTFVARDFDGDGHLDLVGLSSENAQAVQLLLGNGDGTFRQAKTYGVDNYPGSILVGDFDGDGKPDVAVADRYTAAGTIPKLQVLLGTPGGGLHGSSYTGQDFDLGGHPYLLPYLAAAGDFDGNGTLDLIGGQYGEGAVLRAADGTLTVKPATTAVGSAGVVGDFDRDGKLDFVLVNDSKLHALRGRGDGTFLPTVDSTIGNGWELITADFDRDGLLDVATVAGSPDNTLRVALGVGGGAFGTYASYAVGADPVALIAADLDGDGVLDVVVVNLTFAPMTTGTLSVLLGHGDGTFAAATTVTIAGNPRSIAAGDFDRDGKLDLAVGNSTTTNVAFLFGHGDGTFEPEVDVDAHGSLTWLGVGDLDGDGFLDLVGVNRGAVVIRGRGDGTFHAPAWFSTGTYGTGGVIGDFDLDGRLDLLIPNGDTSKMGFAVLTNGGCH